MNSLEMVEVEDGFLPLIIAFGAQLVLPGIFALGAYNGYHSAH